MIVVASVAVMSDTANGANGSGAGAAFGPGSAAEVSVGGLTNRSSADDFALSVLSVFFVVFASAARAIEGAATAAIGVIRIANDNRQATKTCSLGGDGSRDNCFTTSYF